MSSYKWIIRLIIPFYITIITAGLPLDEGQPYSWASFAADSSKLVNVVPARAGRTVGNLTDVVYKAALRLLRCTAIPDNPHGIAFLDPLVFSFDQLAHRQTIRLDGTINGTESELSQLNINYVTVAFLSASAKFQGLLPRLSITGTYNITGTLANTLPFFGSGPYSVEMRNVSMLVTAVLGSYTNGSLYMSNFIVDFTPESIQVSLGELLGGGPLGGVVQNFLQDASPQIVAHCIPLIQEDLRETIVPAANRRLATVGGLTDLITFLTSFGNVTQSC